MEIRIEKRSIFATFRVNGGNQTVEIEMTPEDVSTLYTAVEKEIWFREDVRNRIEELCHCNHADYDEAILEDKEVENAVLDSYAQYRWDHDSGSGAEEVWSWDECLTEALRDHKAKFEKYKKNRLS